MSKNVIIYDGADTTDKLAELLKHVAGMIEQGYTSGYNPGWEIVDEDE